MKPKSFLLVPLFIKTGKNDTPPSYPILFFCLSQLCIAQVNLIEGSVYLDRNSSGVRDSGDVLQPAVRIYLYEDLNSNGILDATDRLIDSQFTNAGGKFSFSVSGESISKRISSNSDDAEERISNGYVSRSSSDLELGFDGSRQQIVGMRFSNLNIPQGASISSAYIEFECDEADNGTCNINFYGEASDDAAGFSSASYGISSRSKTTANVDWNNIPPWIVNEKYQTPDLSSIIQEIVNRSGWASGNSLVIMADGTGERTAESRNGEPDAAPLLSVTYSNGILDYLVKVNTNDYSTGFTPTTDTVFAVQFSGNGQVDSGISFAFYGNSVACYVADDGTDRLWLINRFSGYHEEIGDMGVYNVEAIAADNSGKNLYACDDGQLGTLDRYTGAFTSFPNPVGSGNGIDGVINFNDIDGLVFDPFLGVLFGTVRRGSDYDVLIKIDTSTGQYIPDAFGSGVDYVEVKGSGFLNDIDDLAINPTSGQLYGINNNGGSNDYLVTIDKNTGSGSIVSLIGVDDVEGLGITNEGLFYATTGDYAGSNSNSFYQINENTGSPTLIKGFSAGNDYEACDCLLGHVNYLLLSLDDIRIHLRKPAPDRVQITIETDQDEKGKSYFIERSGENLKFQEIDSFMSDGSGRYVRYDNQALPGRNLYRIKRLNADGHFDYSAISGINNMDDMDKKSGILISPNPSDGRSLSISQLPEGSGNWKIELINGLGEIKYRNETKDTEYSEIRLDFPVALSPGVYLLQLHQNLISIHQKVIVR